MPYDKKTEDRALSRLMADIERTPRQPQGTVGIALCLALLMFMLGLLLLLTGCNTVAGIGADIQTIAEGTQKELSQDRQQYEVQK